MPEFKRADSRKTSPPHAIKRANESHSVEEFKKLLAGAQGGDFSRSTFERHAALLSDSRLSQRGNNQLRTQIFRKLQSNYGNQYVQRLVNHISSKRLEGGQLKQETGPDAAGDALTQRQSHGEEPLLSGLDVPALQRVKDEEDRSTKQRRVARATQTIKLLGNNLSANLDGHLFNALPAGGGAAEHDNPSGLHAYTDGRLPTDIKVVGVEGSDNKVHTLKWRWSDNERPKQSTMFPKWMPPTHVRTLIGLSYPVTRANNVDATLYAKDTRTYIQHGLDIDIGKSGDTVYPVK